MHLPRLGPLIQLVLLIMYRLLPIAVAGRHVSLIWNGTLSNLNIARLLIAASSFGPAWLVSAVSFIFIWRAQAWFPETRKDVDGNIIPPVREVYETVYHPDGTRHTNCACKKKDSDTHLLRCGHIVPHKLMKKIVKEAHIQCGFCGAIVFYHGDARLRALERMLVGLIGVSTMMLSIGMSLEPNGALKILRLLVMLLTLRFLYAIFKIRFRARVGKTSRTLSPQVELFWDCFYHTMLFTTPIVALVATWSVERLYEQSVGVPQAVFMGGRALTLAWVIVRFIGNITE